MSVTGTQIQVRQAPTATRAFALAALLTVAVSVGFIAGRTSLSRTAGDRPATIESISTTWLGDTPSVRTDVMQKMNELAASTAAVGSSATARDVMRHMNELARTSDASTASKALSVMRHMNQLARPR